MYNKEPLMEYVSNYAKFLKESKNLLEPTNNYYKFAQVFNKCVKIDKRATLIFIKEHIDSFPDEYIEYAKRYYKGDYF